jgi:hypothetical protein
MARRWRVVIGRRVIGRLAEIAVDAVAVPVVVDAIEGVAGAVVVPAVVDGIEDVAGPVGADTRTS